MPDRDDNGGPCRPIVDGSGFGAPAPDSTRAGDDICRPIVDKCRPIVDPIRQARIYGIIIGFVIGFVAALALVWLGIIPL